MLSLRCLPLILLLLISCTAEHERGQPVTGSQELFLIKAKSAEVGYEGKFGYHGTITLSDVDPTVIYYDNVLAREPHKMDLQVFLQEWSKAREQFQTVPPTSEMLFRERGADQTLSVSLKEGTYDPAEKKLTFYVYFFTPFSAKSISDVTLFIKANLLL